MVAVTQIEPLRIRVMSLVAGRQDSSNNFRINVWLAAIEMFQDRPWLGIGPGNSAFNLIYPLYQQPKFNALSAYSVPLELLVEGGIPNLLAGLGLLAASIRAGWAQLKGESAWALPALAALLAITLQLTIRLWSRRRFGTPLNWWWLAGLGGLLIGAMAPVSVFKTLSGRGWTWRGRSLHMKQ